jgi:hypothetical protein
MRQENGFEKRSNLCQTSHAMPCLRDNIFLCSLCIILEQSLGPRCNSLRMVWSDISVAARSKVRLYSEPNSGQHDITTVWSHSSGICMMVWAVLGLKDTYIV